MRAENLKGWLMAANRGKMAADKGEEKGVCGPTEGHAKTSREGQT